MEFSRQEYYSGLPFAPPEHLPGPGIEPPSPAPPALADGFFITEPPGKPWGAEYMDAITQTMTCSYQHTSWNPFPSLIPLCQ